MNRRQKIIISITGIFIVLLALVGLTFGYYLTKIQGNTSINSISVTLSDLKLVYSDGNGNIEMNDIAPGEDIPEKTFTVTNDGTGTVENFKINLENVINTFSRKEDIVYTITCQNTTEGATSTECEDFTVIENEVTSENELIFPSVMSTIATDTLEKDESHTYTLEIEYKYLDDIDQSEDMAKFLQAKVNIYDQKTKFLASEIMKNAKSTSTVDYNKTTYIEPRLQDGTNYSIPAEELSLETERVLSYAFDDDGPSFYYRGNVEDNFVTFAKMCWRIVRINGDGSIKLILEDKDEPCSETMDGNWDIDSGNYGYSIYEPGTLFATDGVTTNEEEIYLVDYLNGNTDYENSMAVAFQEFQNTLSNTINNMYNKNINQVLKSGGWCLGDTGYDGYTYKLLSELEKRDAIISNNDIVYDYGFRTWWGYTILPTFKCNGMKMDKFNDEITSMYVGTISSDEITYSGMIFDSDNTNLYLINDYQMEQALSFLPLSYTYYEYNYDYISFIDSDGYFYLYDLPSIIDDEIDFSFRPAINLSKNITIKGGVGTNNEPYVIG